MSKRLEDEYRQMILDDIPDLWDRIEANLPEKNAGKTIESEATETAIREEPKEEETKQEDLKVVEGGKRKKPVIVRILPWVGAVSAAALIAVIVIPTILIVTLGKKNQKNASATMMYEAQPAAMEEAAPEATNAVAAGDAFYYEDEEADYRDGAFEDSVNADELGKRQNLKSEFYYDALAGINGNPAPAAEQEDAQGSAQKALGPKNKNQQAQGEETEMTEQGEERLYARVESVHEDSGKILVMLTFWDDAETLLNQDENISIEAFSVELSENSNVDPEIGCVYLVETGVNSVTLLEKVE